MPVSSWSRHRPAAAKLGKNQNQDIVKYADAALEAISTAVAWWQTQAKFQNIRINGPIAIAPKGCVSGPDIASMVKSLAPQNNDWERRMSAAIASASGSAWSDYQRSIAIPGLPFYPSFAAYPGPMAPPTPNVPFPLLALTQNSPKRIANSIKSGIKANAGKLEHAEAVADYIAAVAFPAILAWAASVQIQNLLGKGPVPSFAPPFVPVGPVVNGDNLPLPGVLV